MYNKQSAIDMLITADYLRLNDILKKMVEANQIAEVDREELLHKSGLIKLGDGRWKETSNDPRTGNAEVILTLG